MRSVEITAKTREEAIEQGLKQLQVERHEIHTEIVQHGSGGFLGLGRRPWIVRVSTDAEPQRPARQEHHHRGGGRHERGERPERQERHDRPAHRENRPEPRDQARPQRDRRDQRPQQQQQHERKQQHPQQDRKQQQPDRRGQQQPQQQRRQEQPAQHTPRRQEPAQQPRHEARPPRQHGPAPAERADKPAVSKPVTVEQVTEAAALLETVIKQMGIVATVEVKTEGTEGPRLNVKSEDSAILIGRKGMTLDSLQYLVNRMVQPPDATDATERIRIDVEGYLDRRNSQLEEMALELAKKAKETRRRVRVRPLSSDERRIVHLTLESDEEVRTFSVGNTPIRSIIIVPKNEIEDPNRQGGGGNRNQQGGRRNGAGQQQQRHPRRHPRHARQGQPPSTDQGGGDVESES